MKKYYLFILIIVSTFVSLPADVQAVTNSGFIPGQIWYSKEVLVEGETVNIHTAVWNGEKTQISAKVEFYDKNVILGSREVVLASLELKDVFIPWKVTVGDHVISAKIVSSQQVVSGVKEKIVLGRNATYTDKQSVSVVVKNENGEPVLEKNIIQTKLENTGEKINELLPEEVSDSISDGFEKVEIFRTEYSVELAKIKDDTKKDIEILKNEEKPLLDKVAEKTDIQEATKEPIAYIKLFLFTVLTFIFINKVLFYGLIVFIAFLILRKIYRAIRNR